jgi:hypothetical protein
LLLHDDPSDERTLWFGPDATLLALRREDLTGLGVTEPESGRLADVLVRAAAGTGADVVVVPAGGTAIPNDGVGAILRYADTLPT